VDLALDRTGERLLIRDASLRRITVLNLDGSLSTTYSTLTVPGLLRPMVLTREGNLYLPVVLNPVDPPGSWREGMASHGPEGPTGDTLRPPATKCPARELSYAGTTRGSISVPVPFSPGEVWAFTPAGWLVSGCSDTYRIDIRLPDGARRALLRSDWRPVPVTSLEKEWNRGMITARIRLDDPAWTWKGPDLPDIKPAFEAFFTDAQGWLWVVRPGPGRELLDGLQDPEDPLDFLRKPRWENTHFLDAFDAEGRFLGRVDVPLAVRFRPLPWIDGQQLLAVVEAPTGELTVRAYRLPVPQ
jgi:hypothetical protein